MYPEKFIRDDLVARFCYFPLLLYISRLDSANRLTDAGQNIQTQNTLPRLYSALL